ncbi:hypothetical protein [Actinospongicola halichondriae]|uniref:hypothetical protein n=1 Tax=Actinospongicola halichondriae TaxID=3236844 RepID=UPI003D59B4C0
MTVRRALAVAALVFVVAACDPHTVAIRFDPTVGDGYRFRSDITTRIERTIDGETTAEDSESVLDATERVVSIDDDEITLEVTLERDASTQRTYEVRFDRGDRLTAIDLVEGVPAEALGLDLATDLPGDVASPPDGPLEPGTTWEIARPFAVDGRDEPVMVRGRGRVDSLGVVDGHDVAVVIVELTVPIRTTIDTADGVVTVRGTQWSTSRTTYDLAEGVARGDDTEIHGDVAVKVAPPTGIVADPVRGTIIYRIDIGTVRVPTEG